MPMRRESLNPSDLPRQHWITSRPQRAALSPRCKAAVDTCEVERSDIGLLIKSAAAKDIDEIGTKRDCQRIVTWTRSLASSQARRDVRSSRGSVRSSAFGRAITESFTRSMMRSGRSRSSRSARSDVYRGPPWNQRVRDDDGRGPNRSTPAEVTRTATS